mmetsp:Transcript_21330/g.35239  ORF Transcript_21330/g.35239 Transcript_21330/m.35239 type:complete len:91 (-) Transcript_21330:710-982(-)|eukprot:CAMPEP_0184654672 /NCGR_PEP_ID=MMETSP0308-20130426/12339_1 /TAXON_ID=38269 /ORGANISM="Gloeochaete witrockiana, Strain SAG 46.84" /LENGTH=90 /DNA_ID=CAMNT_0027090769 /DNA_START=531 /DNA_END=803 /DNA_ORIENTATION=-
MSLHTQFESFTSLSRLSTDDDDLFLTEYDDELVSDDFGSLCPASYRPLCTDPVASALYAADELTEFTYHFSAETKCAVIRPISSALAAAC